MCNTYPFIKSHLSPPPRQLGRAVRACKTGDRTPANTLLGLGSNKCRYDRIGSIASYYLQLLTTGWPAADGTGTGAGGVVPCTS